MGKYSKFLGSETSLLTRVHCGEREMSQEADPGSGYRRQGGGGTEERCRAIMEVQDELLQQKDALLKDIRVIQKRKIKEMEELYDIKLKKKEFEQELETTKQEIQKMDEQFVQLRQRRARAADTRTGNPRCWSPPPASAAARTAPAGC